VLDPLTVMDCTLSNANYMNLIEDEAYFEWQRLFEKVQQNGGEVVILWHNSNPAGNAWHKTLYEQIISFLQ
jgi:bifunctional pyridoxal-dependent enzyme with beta-cystathionase and maltose regulon repressor activities